MGSTSHFWFYPFGFLLASLVLRCKSSQDDSDFKKPHIREAETMCMQGEENCSQRCPKKWAFYKDTCYGLYTEGVSWSAAEISCQIQKREAHLASILDEKEMMAVAKFIHTKFSSVGHVWIGLHDPRKVRRWEWTDLAPAEYKPWAKGEPNNFKNEEYCVHLTAETGHKQWNDAKCQLEMAYLCKSLL